MTQDRILTAAALIVGYAVIIGFTDNFVQVIAAESGLWQFHAMRSVMAMALLGAGVLVFGLRLRPRGWRAVAARSFIHAIAMMIYFGALAFLPVPVVAAGLFTAPIFVLMISRLVYGQPVSAVQGLAVGLGFLGVVLVLGPQAILDVSPSTFLPVLAGFFYGLGNLATRQWCEGERAETLLAGFFLVLGAFGVVGMAVLWIMPLDVPPGTDGFVLRGWVWPSSTVLFWTFVQAFGSLIAVGMMIRGYQLTDAKRASVLEYVILPASAFWAYALWGTGLGLQAWLGMALIAGAGALIAFGGSARTLEPKT